MEETKVCSKCKIEKNISEFHFRNSKTLKRKSQCKQCICQYARKYRENNLEEIKIKQHQQYENGGKLRKKNYENANREKINKVQRDRYKTDNNFRMKKILRSRFAKTVNKKKIYRSTLNYVDLDLETLTKWFEFQFNTKMNWQNQGKYWDIDHVVPCKSFDLTKDSDIKKCFNWSNLRPMEKLANYRKNDKILPRTIKRHQKLVEKFKSLISDTKSSEKSNDGAE